MYFLQELGSSNSCYSLSDQLKLNPSFSNPSDPLTFSQIEKLTSKLRTDWKMTSICDIVLNHTANESRWLQDHPECTYNCMNSPHLRPCYLLDAAFHCLEGEIWREEWVHKGVPKVVEREEHLAVSGILLVINM